MKLNMCEIEGVRCLVTFYGPLGFWDAWSGEALDDLQVLLSKGVNELDAVNRMLDAGEVPTFTRKHKDLPWRRWGEVGDELIAPHPPRRNMKAENSAIDNLEEDNA